MTTFIIERVARVFRFDLEDVRHVTWLLLVFPIHRRSWADDHGLMITVGWVKSASGDGRDWDGGGRIRSQVGAGQITGGMDQVISRSQVGAEGRCMMSDTLGPFGLAPAI